MENLSYLAILACPIGMGLMMWFMAKGMRNSKNKTELGPSSIDDLRKEQGRIAAGIDRVE